MVDEVVRNQVEPALEQREKGVKARQGATHDPLSPEANAAQSIDL